MTNEKQPNILIVEDELYLSKSIQSAFEDEEIDAHVVSGGKEGLVKLESMKIDVCIVDMRLPDMTGNEFILAAKEKHPKLKFIINTGSIDYSIPKELREIGIKREHVFIKPVKDLLELINAVLKIHHEKDSDC